MIRAFNKPFSFEGRIGRVDFIYVFISAIIITMPLWIGTYQILYNLEIFATWETYSDGGGWNNVNEEKTFLASMIATVPGLWFLFAQGTKRLHDINLSGWVQIIYPVALFLMINKDSDPDDNQYGKSLVEKKAKIDNKPNTLNINDGIAPQSVKENPAFCPQCKSPSSPNLSTCEWCGYQF